jgi:hypothetical protein
VVEWRSGGVMEWRSGGVMEWWSNGVMEWRSGGVMESEGLFGGVCGVDAVGFVDDQCFGPRTGIPLTFKRFD